MKYWWKKNQLHLSFHVESQTLKQQKIVENIPPKALQVFWH